jgi:plasmid maintenance system antidote protein VapI
VTIPKPKPTKRGPDPDTPLGKWCLDNGRTQVWLAHKLGVSIVQMSRIMRGVNMPKAALALRISATTGVSVEELTRFFAAVSLRAARRQQRAATAVTHAL